MRFATIACLTTVSSVLSLQASAVCDQTAAGQAERDLWAKHHCWRDFYLWQVKAYNLQDSDWTNRGWDDACNALLEYPKHWNAAFLISFGLPDNEGQFHGTKDYRATAEAGASAFHDELSVTIKDGTHIYGSHSDGVITSYCPLYNFPLYEANPASRAGTFLHESWHAWFEKYGFDNGDFNGHHKGPLNNCSAMSCDYFFFHELGDFAFGEMYNHGGAKNLFHSPIQVQFEYLCDVATQSSSWVPASVKLDAQLEANARGSEFFINAPAFSCGSPTPLLSPQRISTP
jgi:hypothetical protein